MTDIKYKKLLYYLTSLNNLSSILKNRLIPRAQLNQFHDIEDQGIIKNRKKHKLENYVPFHWFSKILLMVAFKILGQIKNLF
ncbi:DarT ssDNA thymidine ADP-ribosyltransferase family protein [Thorsellia kenyensis]|uniref:DarT ssDNA thymidine ADP-ribosyltransferase family protein n=1 Tax=Thorsellia kenyensis TaxID=1549888 RepID=A0ABV6CCW7_9GAMM